VTTSPAPQLLYALHLLPPGRFPFRRWRFELWHGPTLLATGWRTSERHAERALAASASRWVHRRLGVVALRPDAAAPPGGLVAGSEVWLECGPVSCLLRPLAARADAA